MLTQRLDLHSGDPIWDDNPDSLPTSDPLPPSRSDVAIIGAGITGSILAERLSAEGHSVVMLDRRPPAFGSTAASTAQVMWAMDIPLCQLTARIGEADASRTWRRVYEAVCGFRRRLDELGVVGERTDCPTVYLEGSLLDREGLVRETGLHRKAGLPSVFLDRHAIADRFAIAPRAGIVSDDGMAIDPVRIAHGLLTFARARGARICYPHDVVSLTHTGTGIAIMLAGGETLEAAEVILATGYERAELFLPPAFRLLTTFVVASRPGDRIWPERAMIWEACDPYLYVRSDAEGRIIAGGGDEDFTDERTRDRVLGRKSGELAARASAVLGREVTVDRAWAATFGTSPDGLPAIGRAANFPGLWLAAGYGGNGIAFSALAAELLSAALQGTPDRDARCFDPYRFQAQ